MDKERSEGDENRASMESIGQWIEVIYKLLD